MGGVGAGAVAGAGLLTIVRTGPTMLRSLTAVVSGLRRGPGTGLAERTDRDLPGSVLVIGIAVVVTLLALATAFPPTARISPTTVSATSLVGELPSTATPRGPLNCPSPRPMEPH